MRSGDLIGLAQQAFIRAAGTSPLTGGELRGNIGGSHHRPMKSIASLDSGRSSKCSRSLGAPLGPFDAMDRWCHSRRALRMCESEAVRFPLAAPAPVRRAWQLDLKTVAYRPVGCRTSSPRTAFRRRPHGSRTAALVAGADRSGC